MSDHHGAVGQGGKTYTRLGSEELTFRLGKAVYQVDSFISPRANLSLCVLVCEMGIMAGVFLIN